MQAVHLAFIYIFLIDKAAHLFYNYIDKIYYLTQISPAFMAADFISGAV